MAASSSTLPQLASPKAKRVATPSPPYSPPEIHSERGEFIPPVVEPGDVVIWHQHGAKGAGVPATVTRINNGCRSLSLNVLKVNQPVPTVIEAVYHEDDPRLKEVHKQENGCWRLHPREQRLRQTLDSVLSRLDALESDA